ncbi:MAG: caspase family protein [Actinomycetota bacterium]|nr:caspase family protein [Actinomycetota bacterium]
MKRALLVGIDEYEHWSPLGGCVNDVMALTPLLARHEDATPNFDCQTRTSNIAKVSRDVMLEAVERLLAPGADVALFYFAGHGAQEANDVTLVAADGTRQSPGVKLSELLAQVEASVIGEVVMILDCCFSGSAGGVPQLGASAAAMRPGLSMLTASRGDQTSAETAAGRGLFSTYLSGALDGGAADVLGKVNLAGLFAYLTESFGAWEQRPTLKANVDRLHELRKCAPAVPLEELRRLPELFGSAEADLPLDPSYEPTAEPHDTQHEADFAVLQHCRAAKLVDPVDAEHLYFAAMNCTACRLTPLGRHYRHMAAQDWL